MEMVQEIKTRITTLRMNGALLPRTTERDIYAEVLELGISKLCNDASLVLREVHGINAKDRLPADEERHTFEMARASKVTVGLANLPYEKACGCFRSTRINELVATCIEAVVNSVEDGGPSGAEVYLDLRQAMEAYLNFAKEWELLLWDLRRKSWAKKDSVSSHPEIREITHSLSRVTLDS